MSNCGDNASFTPAPECVFPEGTLEITENGIFDVTEYASADVNVSGGGGKNAQIADTVARTNSTTYQNTTVRLKVAKTGTYDVYWVGVRYNTQGTMGSRLSINGTDYGEAQETFEAQNLIQLPHLSSVNLTEGQTVSLKAKGSPSYAMNVMNLVIIEI